MPRVADYDVVTDYPTSLGAGAGQTPRADLDVGFDQEFSRVTRSVLSYMVHPGSSGMTFKMSIVTEVIDANDEVVLVVPGTVLPAQSSHVRQEVIDGNAFWPKSVLRVEVTSGSGTFSDIVIWYQINI